jgi:hypothetical protein
MWGSEVFSCEPDMDGALKKSNSANVMENAPIMNVLNHCDVAVASDVVYDPSGYEPLLASVLTFLHADTDASHKRRFIMAHRHRNPEDYRSDIYYILYLSTTQMLM